MANSWLSALGFGNKHQDAEGYVPQAEENDFEHNIFGYSAVNQQGETIGHISDYVLDGNGKLRYLIVQTSGMLSRRKILVPVGMATIEDEHRQVVFSGLRNDQLDQIPDYDESCTSDPNYEARLMNAYYPNQQAQTSEAGRINYDQYESFKTPDRLQLLEERLQINKRTESGGQVTIGKHVETRQESIEVPLSHERLVIERHPVTEGETAAQAGELNLKDDQITIPLYREEVDVTKRAVVAEEVTIRKERETETRTVSENVARERLDIEDPNQLAASSERATRGTVRDPDSVPEENRPHRVGMDQT
jgi:uncharacterized protein (TIGR02271 family)